MGHSGAVSLNFVMLIKVCFIKYYNQNKTLASLTVYFALKTWLQACLMPAYTSKLVAF